MFCKFYCHLSTAHDILGSENSLRSPIGGYLISGLDVEGDIKEGNWLMVRVHRRNILKKNVKKEHAQTCKWGWSIVKEHGHTYLMPQEALEERSQKQNESRKNHIDDIKNNESVLDENLTESKTDANANHSFNRTFSFQPSREPIEWTQCTDERGRIYYFNPITSDSRKVRLKCFLMRIGYLN